MTMEMDSYSFMFSLFFFNFSTFMLLSKMSLVFCNSIAYLVSVKHQSSENFSKGFYQA